MAIKLTGAEFEAIRNDFVAVDKDGDGLLTHAEIKEYIKEDNNEKAEFMMRLMDLDTAKILWLQEHQITTSTRSIRNLLKLCMVWVNKLVCTRYKMNTTIWFGIMGRILTTNTSCF